MRIELVDATDTAIAALRAQGWKILHPTRRNGRLVFPAVKA